MGGENPTVDQVTVEEDGGTSPLEENLKSRSTWLRLIFMLVFCVLISLASLVGTVVVVLGFLWVLFKGEVNQQLKQAGQGLASYIFEIVRYLTFNSDEKPFPFGREWPSASSED